MRTEHAHAKPRPTTRRTSAARYEYGLRWRSNCMPFPPQTRVRRDARKRVEAFRTEFREQGGRSQDLVAAKGTRTIRLEPPDVRAIRPFSRQSPPVSDPLIKH
jgi:hypothetical protein